MCLECGYNLRTQARDGQCPECGTAVATTLREDSLAGAPLAYRSSLAEGSWWLVVAVASALPLAYPGLLISTWAAWMLTRCESGRVEPRKDWAVRIGARLLIVLGGLAASAMVAGAVVAIWNVGMRVWQQWWVIDANITAAHGAWALGMIGLFRWLTTLARRAGDAALERRSNRVRKCWTVALVLVALLAVAASLADIASTLLHTSAQGVAPVLVMAMLALLIWLWVVTLRFAIFCRRRFRTLAFNNR